MINIRQNVFETNSSSTHSITISLSKNANETFETILPDKDGNIVLEGGDFSTCDFSFKKPLQKANLIAVYAVVNGDNDLKERFEKLLKDHTGASNIVYDIRFFAENGKTANTYYSTYLESDYRYTENGSMELEELIEDDHKLKLFIFGKGSTIYSYNGE